MPNLSNCGFQVRLFEQQKWRRIFATAKKSPYLIIHYTVATADFTLGAFGCCDLITHYSFDAHGSPARFYFSHVLAEMYECMCVCIHAHSHTRVSMRAYVCMCVTSNSCCRFWFTGLLVDNQPVWKKSTPTNITWNELVLGADPGSLI